MYSEEDLKCVYIDAINRFAQKIISKLQTRYYHGVGVKEGIIHDIDVEDIRNELLQNINEVDDE